MYNEFIEVLIKGGIQETTLLFVMSIPLIVVLLNIARYIIGMKSFRIYGTLAIIFLLYEIGGTFRFDGSSDIAKGIGYGTLAISIIFASTIITYELIKKVKLHYFPKITTVIIGSVLGIILTMYLAQEWERQIFLRLAPTSVIFLIIIADQILEIYLKKSLSSTLFTMVETLGISILSYLIVATDVVKQTLFSFPYIIFILIGINILIGKYTGLRLTEFVRFYDLLLDRQEPKDEASTDSEE